MTYHDLRDIAEICIVEESYSDVCHIRIDWKEYENDQIDEFRNLKILQ